MHRLALVGGDGFATLALVALLRGITAASERSWDIDPTVNSGLRMEFLWRDGERRSLGYRTQRRPLIRRDGCIAWR